MRSQEMFNLMQSGKEIRVALETDGDRVGGLLNEKYPLPVDEGEPAFDYRTHMRHLREQLSSATDKAAEADDDHGNSLIRVSRLVDERKQAAEASFDKLVAARQGLESLYPRGGFELANVSGDTPRAPERLVEQLSQTIKLLQQPAVELRQHKVAGWNLDRDEMASDLESERLGLRTLNDRLDSSRKLAEGTLLVKRETIDELRRTIVWVGRTSEGLFHLADENELAERIRSSTRRPARPSEKAPEPPAEETAAASEPPPAAEPASEPQTTFTSTGS